MKFQSYYVMTFQKVNNDLQDSFKRIKLQAKLILLFSMFVYPNFHQFDLIENRN